MATPSIIFFLFMFTLLAALGYAALQVFVTTESQKRHGDDKHAFQHKIQRAQAEVEAVRRGES
jgi:hypothetical protein